MDSLKDIINDIKFFVMDGIITLPLSIAAAMLAIGLFTSNYAMLFFLVGFLLATPLVAFGINMTVGTLSDMFKVKSTDVCMMTAPFRTMNTVSKEETCVISEWLAMMLFFVGYIMMNGYQLYAKDPDFSTVPPDTKPDLAGSISTRHTHAGLSMGAILIVAIGIIWFRYNMGCESFSKAEWYIGALIVLVGGAFYIGGGVGWYYLLSLVGENRLSDLFGIANRLLATGAWSKGPVACIPV
jgi:hypothetical protein